MTNCTALPAAAPESNALPSAQSPWHARLHLGFSRVAARTVLHENRHCGPLRVQKALYPEGDAVCQALLLHPPSGLAGGDHLAIHVDVAAAAHAQLTTPGAGKWYRTAGEVASQTVNLQVAAGATLEWLPQESIVFDGARARMETRVILAADSCYLGWDILCLGRAAAGERFARGQVDLLCRIERERAPLWLERGGFAGDDPLLSSPAGWAGASVCGTLLCVFPGLTQQAPDLLAACRALVPADQARHGLTVLPGVLIARYLGHHSEAARQWLVALWRMLRPACCGRPAVPPRIWMT